MALLILKVLNLVEVPHLITSMVKFEPCRRYMGNYIVVMSDPLIKAVGVQPKDKVSEGLVSYSRGPISVESYSTISKLYGPL